MRRTKMQLQKELMEYKLLITLLFGLTFGYILGVIL